ncbi:MAG: hypothetical protein ACXWPM_08065 [Bdellovibrionota bacterium]
MLKSNVFAVLMVAGSLIAAGAQASVDGNGNGKDNGKGNPRQAQPIRWDEFRDRCANPQAFQEQVSPTNIVVQCTQIQHDFVQDKASGEIPMPNSARVITEVFSSKWFVPADSREQAVVAKAGQCLRYREVERTISVDHQLTCDEILSMKGDIDDFCAGFVDAAKGSNPKLVDEKDTGRVIDTCGGLGGNIIKK